jgi:iron complex transport system ATP-binding protein
MDSMAISLRDVGFVRQGRAILSGINLDVERGSCCAIMGPNGSGKSTLVAIISGYLWPTAGSVCVFGRTYGKVDLRTMRSSIGLIETSRAPAFPEYMTVREIVATGLSGLMVLPDDELTRSQWRRVDVEMDALGIADFAGGSFAELSSGEQMKALIARVMVSSPKLVVLDEPTAGLDMRARAQVVASLDGLRRRKRPATVVIVSHHLDELPHKVDTVVLMREGEIAACGRPASLLTSTCLSRAFGCKVTVVRKSGRYMAAVKSSPA